jgi:acetyl esterase/lipase
VSLLLGKGDGTFESTKSVSVRGQPTSVAAADLNGDGFPDLVVTLFASPQPSKLSLLLGNGDGSFRPPQTIAVGVAPMSAAVADFNGDGIPDLAVANSQSDNVSILLGKGDGTFASAQNYLVAGYPQSITVGDFNGDGIPDLVTAGWMAAVSVLLGNGDGTFQVSRDFEAGALPVAVALGDFNGDGRADLVVADFDANNVSVLINNTPQPGDGVTLVRGLAYHDGPDFNPQKQVLDVYLPPQASGFSVVFLVHGGGWERGNQSRLGYIARTLAREGLGVVAITHRLTDGTPQQVVHPGHIEDVARAFAWTYNHMADYGGNVGKIVLMGHSSGGHLISLLATDPRYLAAHGLSPDLIKAAITVSGPYDLRGFGILAFPTQEEWDASPLKYVGEHQPPFQILYTDRDLVGAEWQARTFYQALVKANSEAELIEVPQRDHFTLMSRTALPGDPAREAILRFIAAHTP